MGSDSTGNNDFNEGKAIYENDSEEENDEEQGVALGFLENREEHWPLAEKQFASKAGGVPAWLDPINLPSESSSVGGICGEPLQFLLQVHFEKSSKETAFHRSLFVFICLSMSCLRQDQHEQRKHYTEKQSRSVKVFRCQLPANSSEVFGSRAPLCSWCGTWKGRKLCGCCKMALYCSKQHQISHWQSGHKTDCHQKDLTSISNEAASKTLWPEYEVIGTCESYFELSEAEDGGQKDDVLVKRTGEDSSIQAEFNEFEGDSEQRHRVAFLQRLAKDPDQVLRFSAKPLWPTLKGRPPSEADVAKCRYCGGPMAFEFQIMSQLLYYLGVEDHEGSLDWTTIVVCTCRDSCDGIVAYKEEFAWVCT